LFLQKSQEIFVVNLQKAAVISVQLKTSIMQHRKTNTLRSLYFLWDWNESTRWRCAERKDTVL